VVTLGIASAFLFPALLAGQVPRRLKPYLPYPTLSDEICDLTGQNCEESVEEIPRPRVSIDSVKFVGTDSLSPAVRHRVLGSLKSSELAPGPFSHDWLRELEEMGPRRALREAGYFRANVVAEAQIQKVDVGSQHLDVTLRIDEGPLYHLGSIQFRSASDSNPLAFAFETLRQQIALRDGAAFDVSKVRTGLDSLSRLYGARGYIDFTPEPQTEIDEGSGTISLIIILDQQRQYRVGKVEVWGPDHAKEKLLQSQWETGGIFNHKKLETFFKENKYLLPADASPEDVAVLRNAKEGTVDLKFDFRVCPQAQL
jgi:outer membrane protein assembly factor BamA